MQWGDDREVERQRDKDLGVKGSPPCLFQLVVLPVLLPFLLIKRAVRRG